MSQASAVRKEVEATKAAILAQREKINPVILKMPVTPPPRAAPTIQTQWVGPAVAPTTPPAPVTPPVETPVDEVEFSALLDRLLPQILAAVEVARVNLKSGGKLTIAEGIQLATLAYGIVSQAVADGAPLIQDASARALVLLIAGVLFDRLVVPLLPAWLKPFAPLIKIAGIKGLEAFYKAVVKPGKPNAASAAN